MSGSFTGSPGIRPNKSSPANVKSGRLNRRNFIKGMALIPAAGAFGNLAARDTNDSRSLTSLKTLKSGRQISRIRLGIIGFGFRGEQLARSLKLAHPQWLEEQKKAAAKNPGLKVLDDFYNLEDLNIVIAAVCDVYDVRVQRGIQACGTGTEGYKDYRKMLARKDIDGIIIATPDHWHATMATDALKAGKHVYLENCLTRTAGEAVALKHVAAESPLVFQLGHQGRQNDLQRKARDLYRQGILGKISLVEITSNRNNPLAAWIWPMDEQANETTVDWPAFQGPVSKQIPFSPERFFRWRCWWDYGTGMAGDLLTHDFDAMNHVMDLGIPFSAMASGGVYYYKDGREVPDVLQVSYEYPHRELSLLYSGTLASGVPRGTLIMGHDATLELGNMLTVWADAGSTKYKSRIESGMLQPSSPIVRYRPPDELAPDAVTSATGKYFADRGLVYTYVSGKRVDTTHLHLAEWLKAIRNGGRTSCSIEAGFEEAIAAHMATLSFREKKIVYWDKDSERIVSQV